MDKETFRRYSRQISIEEIGEKGQEKLLRSSVFVVGCGALGSMVAMQLASAGVGRIGMADFDTVDISNLQRQLFFKTSDAGSSKALQLEKAMLSINPAVKTEVFRQLVDKTFALNYFSDYDFIIDATDNPSSKSMIEHACDELGKYCCVAGVSEYKGQIMTVKPGGEKFTDMFSASSESDFLPCSAGGVLGATAVVCASIQATEAIKYLVGIDGLLTDSILVFDLLTYTFKKYLLPE